MEKNSTLEKRLLKYSAMASGVVAMAGTAGAQINYTDITPDVIVTGDGDSYIIDFDGDTNDDIMIATLDNSATGTYQSIPYTAYYQAVPVVPGTGAAVMINSSTYADALSNGAAINSVGNFQSSQASAAGIVTFNLQGYGTYGPYSFGPWLGASDKFLGVRFTVTGNTHYGWVRMSVDGTATTVTIKDYAWNGTADGTILAGQMVGLNNISEDLALFRFNNNRVEIKTVKGTNGNITIVNTEGKVVVNQGMNNTTESVDLSNLSAGMYIVNVQFNEGAVSHKVVVR